MSEYHNKDGMYMIDNDAILMAKFDSTSNVLEYTLDVACNDNRTSFFAQLHEVNPVDVLSSSFEIVIESDNLFYDPLLSLLGELSKVSFVDEKIKSKKLHISLEKDDTISLFFDLPENKFNTTNIHISREDENFLRFQQFVSSLQKSLSQYSQGRQK